MLDDQVRERIQVAKDRDSKYGNQKRRDTDGQIKVGEYVWLSTEGITMPWDKERRTKKLRQTYYGPFEVLLQTSPASFQLKLPSQSNIFPVFHANLLKPASSVDMRGRAREPLPALSIEDNTYEVESILAKRTTAGKKTQYLVHWKSYLYEEATWEPLENLGGCAALVHKFEAKLAREQPDATAPEDDHMSDTFARAKRKQNDPQEQEGNKRQRNNKKAMPTGHKRMR